MILVDTSVWIDFFNGFISEEKVLLHRLVANQTRIALTDIILTEILQGIRDQHQFERVKNTLVQLDVLHAAPIKSYVHAAEIYRICREKGLTIRKTNDCLIAAVAIENGCPLLHRDKDFTAIARFVNLEIYSK